MIREAKASPIFTQQEDLWTEIYYKGTESLFKHGCDHKEVCNSSIVFIAWTYALAKFHHYAINVGLSIFHVGSAVQALHHEVATFAQFSSTSML